MYHGHTVSEPPKLLTTLPECCTTSIKKFISVWISMENVMEFTSISISFNLPYIYQVQFIKLHYFYGALMYPSLSWVYHAQIQARYIYTRPKAEVDLGQIICAHYSAICFLVFPKKGRPSFHSDSEWGFMGTFWLLTLVSNVSNNILFTIDIFICLL